MSNTPEDYNSLNTASSEFLASSTPTPNRLLFTGSRDPPTTLSKNQYMAMAWHHINQTNPNLSVVELEHYVSQYEMAYGDYLLNPPLEFNNPPPPPMVPHGFGPPLPLTSTYISPAINVIVNQGAYTEKEREVEQLKPDATLQEFHAWQKSARATLSLIDHYQDPILTRPRMYILFGSSVSEADRHAIQNSLDETAYGDTETVWQAHRNYGYHITTSSPAVEYATGHISTYHLPREIQNGEFILGLTTRQFDLTGIYQTYS